MTKMQTIEQILKMAGYCCDRNPADPGSIVVEGTPIRTVAGARKFIAARESEDRQIAAARASR